MAERTEHLEAVLLSAVRPSQEQEKRFLAFLAEKYGEGTTLTWQKSDDYPDGFRLEVGAEVYDWSAGGRLSQFKDALEKLAATQGDVIPLLKETVLSWTPQAMAQEVGTVLTVGDGIARVDGLEAPPMARCCFSTAACAAWCRTYPRTASAASSLTTTRASAQAARSAAPDARRAFPWARVPRPRGQRARRAHRRRGRHPRRRLPRSGESRSRYHRPPERRHAA